MTKAIDPSSDWLNRKWTTGMVDEVRRLAAVGYRVYQIAERFNVPVNEMHEMMKRNGIMRNI